MKFLTAWFTIMASIVIFVIILYCIIAACESFIDWEIVDINKYIPEWSPKETRQSILLYLVSTAFLGMIISLDYNSDDYDDYDYY